MVLPRPVDHDGGVHVADPEVQGRLGTPGKVEGEIGAAMDEDVQDHHEDVPERPARGLLDLEKKSRRPYRNQDLYRVSEALVVQTVLENLLPQILHLKVSSMAALFSSPWTSCWPSIGSTSRA